ncbi:hypothetical protein ACIBHX_20670 [Nonomuraea sp. NPDC050536]|uniref:hypothetical protein n=1 Tax=Nonomuraea sp. NPDC050536 TaxID=3364366 RepID=UPI0037C4FE0E
MAVTLQAVRVSPAELAAARTSSAELGRIVGFDARPAADYLDLNWANGGLLWLSERAGKRAEAGMRRALDGDVVIDSSVADRLGLYSPVSFVEPVGVAEVAQVLAVPDLETLLERVSTDSDQGDCTVFGSVSLSALSLFRW